MSWQVRVAKRLLSDIRLFSRLVVRRELRSYQLEPARAILDSVLNQKGLTFAVAMSRQAGKNELSAQLEAYLLNLFQRAGGFIVKVAPTYRPQLINSKMRLEATLENQWNRGKWRGREGYMIFLGKAGCVFLSADRRAQVVGATASLLLECDEAQDVSEEKWQKDFVPMAASTNATRVFYGTVWTKKTLLARVMRELEREQARDGVKRLFSVHWEKVAEENPEYGEYVRKEISRKGRQHPLIRTQYFLDEIDAQGGLFDERRRALMQGEQRRQHAPTEGKIHAATLDVAGEDEEMTGEELRMQKPRKDSTCATIFEVDLSTVEDPLLGAPTYRVVDLFYDTGTRHTLLYGKLMAYFRHWGVRWIVADASGVGAGLISFLSSPRAFGHKVIPFQFSPPRRKSDLGWAFLSVVETGRFKYFVDDGSEDWAGFWREVEAVEYEVSEEKRMRWGVPDGVIVEGVAVHDDRVVSAALVAELDGLPWARPSDSFIIERGDPLEEIDKSGF